MKFEAKYLIPLLVLLVVLVIKNIKSNRSNNIQNVENFQNNNVMPTTIDYRTINIKQGNNDGSYLLLGKFPSTKTNLSFYLDMLPNEHFNGRTQYGFSFSDDTKSCYHELVFGIPSFGNLMVILRESEWNIVLKKVAPQENTKYKVAMPCILTTSGDLNTSEFLNINSDGESLLDTFVPTDAELKEAIVSVQNTDRYKSLINQTLENNGLKLGDQEVEISRNLKVNGHVYTEEHVDCKGVKFVRERNHINEDGALYRHKGQIYLTHDDNLILRDTTNSNKWTINGKDHLKFRYSGSNERPASKSDNLVIYSNGGLLSKTTNGQHGTHLPGVLYWHK